MVSECVVPAMTAVSKPKRRPPRAPTAVALSRFGLSLIRCLFERGRIWSSASCLSSSNMGLSKKVLTYAHIGMYCLLMPRAATTSDAFNAVAEQRRRDILNYLALQERPVGDIVASLGLEQPSVSKHLRVLKDVGLVRVRREGRQ